MFVFFHKMGSKKLNLSFVHRTDVRFHFLDVSDSYFLPNVSEIFFLVELAHSPRVSNLTTLTISGVRLESKHIISLESVVEKRLGYRLELLISTQYWLRCISEWYRHRTCVIRLKTSSLLLRFSFSFPWRSRGYVRYV